MKKNDNFIAILMSGECDEHWFETEEQAWAFISSRSCEDCRNSDIDACAAEWDVCNREEWESYQ